MGKVTDDAHMHLRNFVSDRKSNNNRIEVSSDAMALRLFPLFLRRRKFGWLKS